MFISNYSTSVNDVIMGIMQF